MKYCKNMFYLFTCAFALVFSAGASAQIDLSGYWQALIHEDYPERIPGPDNVEYQGVPINDAGRYRALAYNSAEMTIPEYQCRPHPADYGSRHSSFRMWQEVDMESQRTTALRMRREWQAAERTVHMDGRDAPSEFDRNTWQGFSTGYWVDNLLYIDTTKLKQGYIRRNGIPRSDKAEMQEVYARHGDIITVITTLYDPLYMTEPLVRASNYRYNPRMTIDPYPCQPVVEIQRARDAFPHYLPGQNPFYGEFAERYGLNIEDTLGGAHTMYPR